MSEEGGFGEIPDGGPGMPVPDGEGDRGARGVDCERRLQEAERRAEELSARVEELEDQLEKAGRDLEESRRRREVERLLTDAGALDVEAAALLVERTVEGQSEPDLAGAVRELRRNKPALFRASGASAMSGRVEGCGGELEELAEHAAATGDRRQLLRYLRLRRGRG